MMRRSEQLKSFGLIIMIIDHISLFIYGGNTYLYAFARWGFPFFAYGVSQGALHTSRPARYLFRMFLVGILSQPFFSIIAYDPYQLNIIFTLILGAAAVMAYRKKVWPLALLFVVIGGGWSDPLVSYGAYGVGLILAFGIGKYASLVYLIITSFVFYLMGDIQCFAIIAWPLIYKIDLIKISLPRWFYYVSYPGHLMAISVITKLA